MEERPAHPSEYQSRKLVCHHCGAVNPPKAYCCLSCFKVLRPKSKPPLVELFLRPSVTAVAVLTVALLIGLIAMKKWIDRVEARVQMDLKTADYNISVVADKKRKEMMEAGTNARLAEIDAAEEGRLHQLPQQPQTE